MRWETLSCAEVKEPVGTVGAQSDRVCPDLLKNQWSAEPMVNRCAPGVFYRDHIGCVVLAWSPRGTARSHTLLNLERALEAQTILSCFLACILAWISIFRRPILPRSRLNPLFWIIYSPLIPEIHLCVYVIYPACFAAGGVRWYNVDVRSVKRSPVLSPEW